MSERTRLDEIAGEVIKKYGSAHDGWQEIAERAFRHGVERCAERLFPKEAVQFMDLSTIKPAPAALAVKP